MQPQSTQNIYVPQNAANNSTARANQPAAANIYRQNPSSPAPRNRYVHPTTMYPGMHQGVVLGQFTTPYATRTPQIPQCQYPAQFYPQMYYPCYVQQPTQQPRATVNPGVSVGLSNAVAVQPAGSVSGPTTAGNQGQIQLGVAPVAGNTVLGVANTTTAQPVGVAPLVSMPHQPPHQQSQNPPTKGKLRSHAIQIIDPITNRNILDDLDIDKNDSANISEATSTISSTPKSIPNANFPLEVEIDSSSTSSSASVKSDVILPETSKVHTDVPQHVETSTQQTGGSTIQLTERNFKDATQQQTPVVSAMSDAPSVEIFPTQPPKQRSKKSQNISAMKNDQHICQGKSDGKGTTVSSNCVHKSLITNYTNQKVPQEKPLKKSKPEEESILLQSSIQITNDNSVNKESERKGSYTEGIVVAREEETAVVFDITEPVKIVQVGENESLLLPQQEQINNIICDEQQPKEKHQGNQISSAKNGNDITTATTLTDSKEKDFKNNDFINNNNNNNNNKKDNSVNKNHSFPKSSTILSKSAANLDKKDNLNAKSLAAAVSKSETEATQPCKTSSTSNISSLKPEVQDEIKKDRENVLNKNEFGDKQTDIDSGKDSVKKLGNDTPPNISIRTERTEIETRKDLNAEDEKKEQDVNSSRTNNVPTNKQPCELLINYNEGQWSPSNPNGKKQYDKDQLMKLREAGASCMRPELKNSLIISQTNLMPAFHRGNKKVQSMIGGFGASRGSTSGDGSYQNYIKQSSMSGRGGTDNGHHNRNSGKPIIHLNLSLNQDVKLNEADNAWRPRVLAKLTDTQIDPEQKAQREKDELIRRVRGILNKLTPEKFEPLVEEIIKLKIDTMDKMEAVMILVFEKAIDEPNFSVSYANLCYRLISEVKARDERMESGTKTNLASFRCALLDKTEREFNQNVTKSNAKEEKLKPIKEKISSCTDPNEKIELEAQLDEEERKIRRRSGGTVRFIGELFKISILTGRIINTCIEALLKDPNNEDMLECLCKLLTTVGQKFEKTSYKDNKGKYSLDYVIERMQNIASKNENSKISSRVRFMLQDVIDLRKKNWQSTRNEAPKTMEQIEKEANNEQLSSSYHYLNTAPTGGIGNKRDERSRLNEGRNYGGSHSQRGDTGGAKRSQGGISSSHSQAGNSNSDDTWHVQTGKGNRSLALDSNKLVGMAVDMNNKKMGAAALFQWNNASSQPTSTPSNSFAALSLDSNRADRDRGNLRNKGSYNKGSIERDRYDHDRLLSRAGSSQASRENSSPRVSQVVRSIGGGSSSNLQKSSSHSKYQPPMTSSSLSRMNSSKMASISTGSGLYRDSLLASSDAHHQQQHLNIAATESIQPLSPPPANFEEPSSSDLKLIKSVVTDMVENAANSKCIDMSTVSGIKKLKEQQLCGLLYYILTDYLHLSNVGPMCRRHLANVVSYLIENKYISIEHFRLAYTKFAELATVLIIDIPELWLYIFEFCGPLIVRKLITINDLWSRQLRESGEPRFRQKFLKTFLQYCTRGVGPSFTRNMWKKNHLKWSSFIEESEVDHFIKTNKFEYVENENCQPDYDLKESMEKRNNRVVEHIQQLLTEGSNADSIIDYINGNIADVDKSFIKSLTTILTNFAIKDSNSNNLDIPCFQKICIPVLLRYIDSKEDLELECLYAIQLLVHSLEHPRGLLAAIFGELNDADVIPQESFIAWRDSKDQFAGKGVAVKALNPFFNQVINGETSDDN